jgi:hypothetical protein
MMKRIAQAWGFAAIVLLPDYIDMTSPAGDARMRVAGPLTKIALAHLTDMLIVAVIFALLMAGLRELKSWPKIRWSLVALLPVYLLARNLNVIPFDVPDAAVAAVSLLWIGVVILLGSRFPRVALRLRQAGSSLLTGFAVFALVMTVQLVRASFWRPGPQAFANAISAAPASKPRLVWILFDELAYKYTFETRDPSLKLPNLDRLRAESTLFTDMTPIAYRTTRAVPSLMLGRIVTDVEYTADNQYLIETEDSPQWQPFDAKASLIGMAKQHGLTTSIVGWYIAYCPIFAKVATEQRRRAGSRPDGARRQLRRECVVSAAHPGGAIRLAQPRVGRYGGVERGRPYRVSERWERTRARDAFKQPGRHHLSSSACAAPA